MILEFRTENTSVLNGEIVRTPLSRKDYLFLCKRFLTIEDYEEVLLSVMDEAYYEDAEPQIQAIVDSYYSFSV
jgi:hypothetical protein